MNRTRTTVAVAALAALLATAPGVQADPLVCPVLILAAPLGGLPGIVELKPDGDVYVAGEPFWDCPPYGEPGPGPQPGDPGEYAFCVPTVTAVEVSCNTGGAGFLSLTAGPLDHHLRSTCMYHRNGRVVGKTVAGNHPTASTVTIRCILKDRNGAVLFDESRSASGTHVTLEGTFDSKGWTEVCTEGSGRWVDTHSQTQSRCKAPG